MDLCGSSLGLGYTVGIDWLNTGGRVDILTIKHYHMDTKYTLAELTPEEAASLTKDLQEVLIKHNCEMGVTSAINLMKRVDEIPSPYLDGDSPKNTKETDTSPEKSG